MRSTADAQGSLPGRVVLGVGETTPLGPTLVSVVSRGGRSCLVGPQ